MTTKQKPGCSRQSIPSFYSCEDDANMATCLLLLQPIYRTGYHVQGLLLVQSLSAMRSPSASWGSGFLHFTDLATTCNVRFACCPFSVFASLFLAAACIVGRGGDGSSDSK